MLIASRYLELKSRCRLLDAYAYAEYSTAQKEMRELLIHRQNVVQFLGLDAPAVQKEKEHGRD